MKKTIQITAALALTLGMGLSLNAQSIDSGKKSKKDRIQTTTQTLAAKKAVTNSAQLTTADMKAKPTKAQRATRMRDTAALRK